MSSSTLLTRGLRQRTGVEVTVNLEVKLLSTLEASCHAPCEILISPREASKSVEFTRCRSGCTCIRMNSAVAEDLYRSEFGLRSSWM